MRRIATRLLSWLGSCVLHLEILLAVALGGQVLRRDGKDVGQRFGHRLGPPVGQGKVGDVGADRVGVALDEEGLRRVLGQDLLHRLGDRIEPRDFAFGDFRRTEGEFQRVEIDAPRLVADARRALHLVERIEPLDLLHRRPVEEGVVLVRVAFGGVIQDVLLLRHVDAQRRQIEAGVAPVFDAVVVGLVDIGQHVFAVVGRDARAADDVAILVPHGHDARAVFANDRLTGAATWKVFVIDLLCTARHAGPVVALHADGVAELDDDAVADLAQHVQSVRPFAPVRSVRCALDAFAFLGIHRCDLRNGTGVLRSGIAFRWRGGRRCRIWCRLGCIRLLLAVGSRRDTAVRRGLRFNGLTVRCRRWFNSLAIRGRLDSLTVRRGCGRHFWYRCWCLRLRSRRSFRDRCRCLRFRGCVRRRCRCLWLRSRHHFRNRSWRLWLWGYFGHGCRCLWLRGRHDFRNRCRCLWFRGNFRSGRWRLWLRGRRGFGCRLCLGCRRGRRFRGRCLRLWGRRGFRGGRWLGRSGSWLGWRRGLFGRRRLFLWRQQGRVFGRRLRVVLHKQQRRVPGGRRQVRGLGGSRIEWQCSNRPRGHQQRKGGTRQDCGLAFHRQASPDCRVPT